MDKNTTNDKSSPCLPTSAPSALSAAGPTSPTLLLPVPRGQTVPLYLRASGALAVSLSSADFAFGRHPDLAAHRPTGRINFPNVSATVPCFHDYRMACGAQHMRRRNAQRFGGEVATRQRAKRTARKGPREDGGRETRRGCRGHEAAKVSRRAILFHGRRSVPPSLRHLRVKRKQYALQRGRKDAAATNLHEFSRIGAVGLFGRLS